VYRAIYVLIVLFWLTMTALLVRNEIVPGDSSLREVPPGHVVKLILHHQQPSDLNIVSDKTRLGQIHIDPRTDKNSGLHIIGFKGYIILNVPGAERQKISWNGLLKMDKELGIQEFTLGVTVNEPNSLQSKIVVLPKENIAHYELSAEKGVLERQDYSLDEQGARDALNQLGIDPAMLPVSTKSQSMPVHITARQSSIDAHGSRMDTYLVTVETNGQTLLECHVDQLGRIVRANTLLGYTFAAEDITP
jgi:hypothetical protein